MKESTLTLNNGLAIPRVSIGTWNLNASEAKKTVEIALNSGIRYIDTAQEYQNENAVANAIRESGIDKKSIIVSTKLTPKEVNNYETAIEGINKSAIIFSGIGIDIMFINAEDNKNNLDGEVEHDNIGIVKALLEAKNQGIIKAYGVSNFSVKELQKIKDSGLELPQIVQLPHSIGNRRQDLIKFCIENNIQMQSYSPFKGSLEFTNDDIIKEIATKYDKTVPEVYLSYAIQTTGSVVFRSLNEEHIKTNINLIPFLKEEDINILNKINAKKDVTETLTEDEVSNDTEEISFIIDNETLLGEKKAKDDIEKKSDNSSSGESDYEIVDDVSIENKELKVSESKEKTDEDKKTEEFIKNDTIAYEKMKDLRKSNKKELESLINSVDKINIYNINYVSIKQSLATTKNNLQDSLRLRIASTINEQARVLLKLNDAERYYFYKFIEEEPLIGRYSELEKKLYENYFIKNPFIETMINSYKESLKNIKGEEKESEVVVEETKEEVITEEKNQDIKNIEIPKVPDDMQESAVEKSNITTTESGVSYDDDFIYYEKPSDEKEESTGLSI